YHKHIHCGEGGMVVTDNDDLAEKIRLIRNHAEAVVEAKGTGDLTNMLGFNYRMTEMEAAVARCQLKKLGGLLKSRRGNCEYLSEKLGQIPAISPPVVREGAEHAYYVQPFKFDESTAQVSRERFIEAVKAELPMTELRESEGVKISCGYTKPLYLQPLFQEKICYGGKGYPFESPSYQGQVEYQKGICPVAERMHEKELFIHELMHSFMTEDDLDDVIKAFEKVREAKDQLH
ncbi:DegT/DnrJ/EryC1/StrS family aminotransferase, partial [Candidatus Pacearchaeota archaeon]|nr:DegT/DnrJ/EryC1/StrS family aminotransferase [Candidatus Pacearchaeota archaeon]